MTEEPDMSALDGLIDFSKISTPQALRGGIRVDTQSRPATPEKYTCTCDPEDIENRECCCDWSCYDCRAQEHDDRCKTHISAKNDRNIVLVEPCRALYEFKYLEDTQTIHHMWLTTTEAATANYVLDKTSAGYSTVTPCPDDCDYRQLPTPWDPS